VMSQIQIVLDFIATDDDEVLKSYETIFNAETCIVPDLLPPTLDPSSSVNSDELDNQVIETLLTPEPVVEVKVEVKEKAKKYTKPSRKRAITKDIPSTLVDLLRTSRKRRRLSLQKFEHIQDRMVVTANNGVLTFKVCNKK
jgi:hypothetical protein